MEESLNRDSTLISVIIPVYNTEKYLDRCVGSLISQSISNIEIVLVDDGSTDGSPAICDNYALKDSRIRVIHKENAGQGLARNDGMKAAKGKYICFLDSDDYYESDTCEILSAIMDSTGADMCSFGYQIDDKDGNVVTTFPVKAREYCGQEIRDSFILHFFGDTPLEDDLRGVFSCMSVFRKDLLEKNAISFPSERVVSSEDAAFCLEYCKHVEKAVTLDRCFYHYCQNEVSFSKGYRADRFQLMQAHIRMLEGFAEYYGNYDKVSDRIGMSAWINLMACYKQEYRNFDRKTTLLHFKEIAENPCIRGAMEKVLFKYLPLKQRVLYYSVMRRLYSFAYILVGIRAKARV